MVTIGETKVLTAGTATTAGIMWRWWVLAWGCIGFEVWRDRVHRPLLDELREVRARVSRERTALLQATAARRGR